MNRFPREPLDADERALAAALPRPHGRSEPDAALDARILAAAHAATQAPARRKRRWPAPLALAASLCLAVGLAWQLREPAPPRSPAIDAKMEPAAPATAFMTPAPADDAIEAPSPVVERSAPAAAPHAATPDISRAAPEQPAAVMPEAPPPAPVAAMPPPPPSPASPPAPRVMAEAAAAKAIAADIGPPVAARALASPTGRARSAEPAERALETQDAPDEDVPPATASSPEVRDAWLRRIGELMGEGRLDEARASLAEFRRRYPEAKLPAELRVLEPASR